MGITITDTEIATPNKTITWVDLEETINKSITYGWKDNIQWFSSAKGRGTSEPTWKDIGNGLYAYNFTVDDELFITFHVNHDYAQGTKSYPHIHFICDTEQDAGSTITWNFDYTIAKGHSQGDSLLFAPTELPLTYTFSGNEVAGEHIVLECSDTQSFDLIEPDTIVMARIVLSSTNNISGNIYGLCSDLHYQADRDSTLNKEPDFYN